MKYLCDEPHWTVEGNPDFTLFFREVPNLFEDSGAVLAISCSSLGSEVKSYLEHLRVAPNDEIHCEPHFIGPDAYHIPVNGINLKGIAVLSEHHAEPEVADHIIVYLGKNVVLEWYDAGANPIWISKNIS